MEERIYHGSIDPNALADHLVATFDQGGEIVAQKVGDANNVMVQIGRVKLLSNQIHSAIGVTITRIPQGVRVAIGQSNWLDLADPGISASLIGSIFFPPLLVFPLMRGIRNYTLYQDIWTVIEEYSANNQATQYQSNTIDAVYCQNCGAVNDERAETCRICGVPLYVPSSYSQLPPVTAQPRMITCPRCAATVTATKYCSNCGTALPTQASGAR